MIEDINYTDGLRQHGWRRPVHEFIQALAGYQNEKLLTQAK